ncbi:MAG: polysaccharide deacetylase family protein [Cytophagales bacterium]|nr:polysaccharide deacetylase family protein [Cytophagales bacterium]
MRLRSAIRYNPLTSAIAKRYTRGIATVFMLHRVAELNHPRLTPNEDLKVSPDYLARTIRTLRQKGYSFVSLDELHKILAYKRPAKNLIVFTLDDGYRDNLTQALPVFAATGVPFTVYVTNCFPNGTANLWWFELEKLVRENDSVSLGGLGQFRLQTPEEKWQGFMEIRALFLENKIGLDDIRAYTGPADPAGLCMNWDEVAELARHPLATIGAHTMSHPALSSLPDNDAYNEIALSKQELESKLSRKIEHFAYPFGERKEVGQREFDLTQQLGFKTAVTTRPGNIFSEHRHFLTALPRIYLYENAYTLEKTMYTDVLWANKLKRVAVL